MPLWRAVLDPKMNPSKWALGRGRNFGVGRDCLGLFVAHIHTHTARTKAPQGNSIHYSGIHSNKLENKYHSIYLWISVEHWGFPGGASGKVPTC